MADIDLDEFKTLSHPKQKTCGIAEALEQLDPDDSAKLLAACAASKGVITSTAIAQWLHMRGIDIIWQRIYPHRQGTCSCNG